MRSKINIHYAWFVVIGAFCLSAATIGLHTNIIGLYFRPLLEEGIFLSRVHLTTAFLACVSISSILGSLVAGRLYKKFSIRIIASVCIAVKALCYFMYSQASQQWHFMAASLIVGIVIGFTSVLPGSILAARWFAKKRTTAIAIIFTGSGFSQIAFSSFIASTIDKHGYSNAFIIQSVLIFIFAAVAFILIRDNPSNMGLEPYGKEETPEVHSNVVDGAKKEIHGIMFSEAIKGLPFYLICAVAFLSGTVMFSLIPHYPNYYRDSVGFSLQQAAIVVTFLGLFNILGKILYGIINDKFDTKKGNIFIFICWVLGLVALILSSKISFFVVLFILMCGVYTALPPVAIPLWLSQLFGIKDYAVISSVVIPFISIGNIVGAPTVGYLIDNYSYELVFGIGIILVVMCYVSITLAYKFSKKS